MRRLLIAAACSALMPLLLACSSTPLDTAPPGAFDLTGRWLLVADLSDAGPGPGAFDVSRPTPPASGNRNRRPRGGFAFIAHDFPVVRARWLNIEQNRDSMGIGYDRGAYRDISWGTRERGLWKVSTGWNDDGALVSRWRASDATASERYELSDGGRRLVIVLDVRAGSDQFSVRRVFTRESAG